MGFGIIVAQYYVDIVSIFGLCHSYCFLRIGMTGGMKVTESDK